MDWQSTGQLRMKQIDQQLRPQPIPHILALYATLTHKFSRSGNLYLQHCHTNQVGVSIYHDVFKFLFPANADVIQYMIR